MSFVRTTIKFIKYFTFIQLKEPKCNNIGRKIKWQMLTSAPWTLFKTLNSKFFIKIL
jgi:hypothetical protein